MHKKVQSEPAELTGVNAYVPMRWTAGVSSAAPDDINIVLSYACVGVNGILVL
jgi:hypothetical protein